MIAAMILSGCALLGQTQAQASRPSATHAHARKTPTASPTATAVRESATPSASPTPTPTTPPPPPPTLTPVPTGTVVAEGDVTSPKGSIHFHYRIVSDGDNTYSAQYSGFTSTVPIPVSVTLFEIPPRVGDGLTFHGVGDHLLGGPTNGAASSIGPIEEGQPSYLKALVTYSSASPSDDVPQELGPDKVLAVNTVRWSVPVRQSNVHPVDGGAQANALGTVSETTAAGAPKRYDVAQGDTTDAVAARFGITVQDLVWLNSDLGTITGDQTLYASTRLNLDPDSL
jgi:LysM repeat protein